MPFITQDRRDIIDAVGLENLPRWGLNIEVGDICYKYYKPMVEAWKANPRWTTAHNIFKKVITELSDDPDTLVAQSLAWQVFFVLHVIPHELKKREESGDI